MMKISGIALRDAPTFFSLSLRFSRRKFLAKVSIYLKNDILKEKVFIHLVFCIRWFIRDIWQKIIFILCTIGAFKLFNYFLKAFHDQSPIQRPSRCLYAKWKLCCNFHELRGEKKRNEKRFNCFQFAKRLASACRELVNAFLFIVPSCFNIALSNYFFSSREHCANWIFFFSFPFAFSYHFYSTVY
jgi:hypothetical protein